MEEKTSPLYKHVMDRWELLDGAARDYLLHCREIAEFVVPRRSYQYNEYEPGWSYRRRLMVDPIGMTTNERIAAFLHGTIMSPYTPWVRPKLMEGEPSHNMRLYFDHMQKQLFTHLNSTQSTFPTASYEAVQDATAFGTCYIMMIRSQRSNLPIALTMPFFQCRVEQNDECRIDTFMRCFTMKVMQAATSERYASAKITAKYEQGKGNDVVKFIQLIEPRKNGMKGGVSQRKPYASIVICETTGEVISEMGFDEFPVAVGRLFKQNDPYGHGFGHASLPLVRLVNRMRQSVLRAAEYANDPPLGVFTNRNGRLDRRPGAVNKIDPADAIFSDPRDMITKLYEGGDPRITIEMIRELKDSIYEANYVDWQTFPERSNVTATEVLERRKTRLTQMTPVVSRLESELLQPVAERFASLMQDQGMFLNPDAIAPGLAQELDGKEIGFEFVSPMAQAQQQATVDIAANLLEMTLAAAQIDPRNVDILKGHSLLRRAAFAAGAMAEDINSEEEIAALNEERARQAEQQAQLEQAALAATALRDGAQGAASLGLGANGAVNQEAA
jgi:hypothetical protein